MKKAIVTISLIVLGFTAQATEPAELLKETKMSLIIANGKIDMLKGALTEADKRTAEGHKTIENNTTIYILVFGALIALSVVSPVLNYLIEVKKLKLEKV